MLEVHIDADIDIDIEIDADIDIEIDVIVQSTFRKSRIATFFTGIAPVQLLTVIIIVTCSYNTSYLHDDITLSIPLI